MYISLRTLTDPVLAVWLKSNHHVRTYIFLGIWDILEILNRFWFEGGDSAGTVNCVGKLEYIYISNIRRKIRVIVEHGQLEFFACESGYDTWDHFLRFKFKLFIVFPCVWQHLVSVMDPCISRVLPSTMFSEVVLFTTCFCGFFLHAIPAASSVPRRSVHTHSCRR